MHKLAKHKTKVHDDKGKRQRDTTSSDEDKEKGYEADDAPYIEQYRYKKKMENKLNDEHYWSEPFDDNNDLNSTQVYLEMYSFV